MQDIGPQLSVAPAPVGGLSTMLPRDLALSRALLSMEQAIGAYSALQTRLRAVSFRDNMIRTESRMDALWLASTVGVEDSLLRLLILDSTGERPPPRELRGAINAIDALEHGLASVRAHGRAGLTLTLLTELQRRLSCGAASATIPSALRRDPVAAGTLAGAHDLELFLTDPPPLPLPVRLALVAARLEMLTPFEKAGGRLGWLLLPLMAVADGLAPLFMARTLRAAQEQYDAALHRLQLDGSWEDWICFFLHQMTAAAAAAASRLERTERLRAAHETELVSLRSDSTARRLSDLAMGVPALTVGSAQELLDVSFQTANSAVATLVRLGLLAPHSSNRRNRVFILSGTLATLADAED